MSQSPAFFGGYVPQQEASPLTTASSTPSCPFDDEDDDALRTVDISVSGARRSIVLAHPDEFKNPSSFLKIYGDPLCSGPSSMPRKGQQGNWECAVCNNVNFPRRFRCHKCSTLRGPSGDLIVSDYACVVYNQLNASIRRNAKPYSDYFSKGNEFKNTNNNNNSNFPNKGLLPGIGSLNKNPNLSFSSADSHRKGGSQFNKQQNYTHDSSLTRRSPPHAQRPNGLSSSMPVTAGFRPYVGHAYPGSLTDSHQSYLRTTRSINFPHQWPKATGQADSPELFLSNQEDSRPISAGQNEYIWPASVDPQ